jgi:hypothetical protein
MSHIENTSCDTGSIVACVYCGRCLEMGLLYCWLNICCGLVIESFPSNGSTSAEFKTCLRKNSEVKVAVGLIGPEAMQWMWYWLWPYWRCTGNRANFLFSLGLRHSRPARNLIKSKPCKSAWWVTVFFMAFLLCFLQNWKQKFGCIFNIVLFSLWHIHFKHYVAYIK